MLNIYYNLSLQEINVVSFCSWGTSRLYGSLYLPLTVASLQMLHFTTCWCVLPSTDMEVWQTRQLMTGALLLSGLPCGEYGGGGSPGATELGNGAKPDEDEEEVLLTLIKQHLFLIMKKYRKYIACSTYTLHLQLLSHENTCHGAPSAQFLCWY